MGHRGYRIPREKHAGSHSGQVGSSGGKPCLGTAKLGSPHTGKQPGQGFRQDREGSGAGFQSKQMGVSLKGEAGEEPRAGSQWGEDSGLGYRVAGEMTVKGQGYGDQSGQQGRKVAGVEGRIVVL